MSYSEEEIVNIKNNAKEIEGYFNIDDNIAFLKTAKIEGENVYVNFNGTKLYALLDDEDSCYKKATGYSKAEWEAKDREFKQKHAEEFKGNFNTLDDIIAFLKTAKIEGENVYVNFNGTKLYAMLDDEDSCYMKLYGHTKAEEDNKRRNIKKKIILNKAKETSNKIYPQRRKKWEKVVNAAVNSNSLSEGLEQSLEIIDLLEEGVPFETAKNLMKNQSDDSYTVALNTILVFSKRGVEFFKSVEPNLANEPKYKKLISKVTNENNKYNGKDKQVQIKSQTNEGQQFGTD